MVIPRGVSLRDLGTRRRKPPGFDTNTAFSKKKNKVNLTSSSAASSWPS